MHLTDLITSRSQPFHTFEFFPPRTHAGFVNLLDRIRRLAAAPLPAPLAVSITWGAGGGTADRTMELAEQVVKLGLDVILHLTCTNMPKEKVDQALAVSIVFHNELTIAESTSLEDPECLGSTWRCPKNGRIRHRSSLHSRLLSTRR